MSRTNHNSYNLCKGPFDENGHCAWHADWRYREPPPCKPENVFLTRRGPVKRRKTNWWYRYWQPGPPIELKKRWRRRSRARQQQQQRRRPDDPIITPFNRLSDPWDWY